MSKMMMGQIDHAKKRVAELKLEKYGSRPVSPTIKRGKTLLKELLDNNRTVTNSLIVSAFDDYLEGAVSLELKEHTTGYGDTRKTTYERVQKIAGSVEDALAAIIYAKENAAEIARFESETELYKTRQEAINIAATDCEDAIVLGDQHAALIALQDFAAFKV